MTRFITSTLLALAIGGYVQADLLIQETAADRAGHRESREGQLAGSLEAYEALLVCFFPPLSPPPKQPPPPEPPEEPPDPPEEPPEEPPEDPPEHQPEPTTWVAGTIGGLICAVRWWRRRRSPPLAA